MYLVLILGVCGVARAGNLDGVFVTDQAAMMAGAVTALADDTTAIYYNPAGLAADTSHASVSVTTSSYGITVRSTPTLVTQAPTQRDDNLTSLQLNNVPAAVAYFVPLGTRLGVGGGLFTPSSTNEWQRASATSGTDATRQRVALELRIVSTEFRAGGGIGYAVTDQLRFGASLFATYMVRTLHFDFAAFQGPDEALSAASIVSANAEGVAIGVLPTLGIQWQPRSDIVVGFAWFAPIINVHNRDAVSSTTLDASGAGGNIFTRTDFLQARTKSGRFFGGVALKRPEVRLALDGSFQAALDDDGARDVWNVRLGGQARVASGMWVGGGVFTDRSPYRPQRSDLGSTTVDFAGVTAGVRLETGYLGRLVSSWRNEEADGDSPILFFATFSVRLASGTGKSAVVAVAESGISEETSDVDVAEASMQLSTGVSF